MLLALADGRALAASVLAAEAGVRPSTASAHLEKLLTSRLVTVEPHGRHRYYRLSGADVARLLEVAARLAPPRPVRSLREGTRAHAVRLARRCYDHLAGRLAVAVTDRLVEVGGLVGGDGSVPAGPSEAVRLSGGVVDDTVYRLTEVGCEQLGALGVVGLAEQPVPCCVDWSEQRHHLAGGVGRALLGALGDAGWLRVSSSSRAVVVTDEGRAGLARALGLEWPPPHGTHRCPAAPPRASADGAKGSG